jgi:hypothetical protein
MCDCYEHKCPMCDYTTPWHIADFLYPREAFTIWCYKHTEYADKEAVLFVATESGKYKEIKHFRDGRPICAAIGPDVGGGNVPNLDIHYRIVEW